MRIISQDGFADIPYRFIAITGGVKESNLYGHSKLLDDKAFLLARYSSPEKASYAMEMLRKSAEKTWGYFRFPKDDEIEVEE